MLADRAADNKAKWARRHPEIAGAERNLRKQRVEQVKRWKHKNEGTVETHARAPGPNQGALARLYKKGIIDSEQLVAAEEIARVSERIGADVAVRTASLETRVDQGRHAYDDKIRERLGQVRREMAYGEWRRLLPCAPPVLDMLIGDPVGYTVAARRYRMHKRRALKLLLDALDLWTEILGAVCKKVDWKALAAAHDKLAA